MWRLLDRMGISLTRGRSFVESPDEEFDDKCGYIDRRRQEADGDDRQVVLYSDEMQFYRRPVVERAWSKEGKQSTVERKPTSKYAWSRHLLCAINPADGRLFWRNQSNLDRQTFLEFYRKLADTYAEASCIWLIQDNLPLHFHEDILAALEPQQWPWEFVSPPTWSDPTEAAKADGDLPIQLTPLPTYASWLNPVERFWRHLKRQLLYLHRHARQPDRLVDLVDTYLDRRQANPSKVLQETGLSCA
jgi:hypothetical protein